MASSESTAPINGNYAPQGYDAVASNYATASTNNSAGYQTSQQSAQPSTAGTAEIPKEEVAWYFVEQYYTTLSKSPDRLYLFYNKRSQFVSGTEEDKVQVCIGQKPINDRIKELDFQDTKVRVTNVDSQSSDANIVIQVIGEISNKGQPHKRFVQTFVLAEQTNGYFVLNDIFRYLAEEPEEEEEQLQQEATAANSGIQEPAPTAAAPEVETQHGVDELATSEEDLSKVDNKLEEVAQSESVEQTSTTAAVNGSSIAESAEVVEAEEAPAAAVTTTEEPAPKEPEPTTEETLEPEKPKDPAPTPAPAAQKPAAPAAPAAPSKPAVPRTWASLAASAHKVATPAVPAVAMPPAPAQSKSAAPAANQPLAVPSQPAAPAREASPANSQGEAAGWQTATGHKKEQSRAQNQAPAADADNKRAYIKNVYSQVEEESLKQAMSKFGEVVYLDISRQKNCAFVDFKTPAAFQAAVNANPHNVNGLELKVEERRLRPANFVPYARGGAPRGRGGIGGQGPRGGFQPRGGRGGSLRGGRGAAQEA